MTASNGLTLCLCGTGHLSALVGLRRISGVGLREELNELHSGDGLRCVLPRSAETRIMSGFLEKEVLASNESLSSSEVSDGEETTESWGEPVKVEVPSSKPQKSSKATKRMFFHQRGLFAAAKL